MYNINTSSNINYINYTNTTNDSFFQDSTLELEKLYLDNNFVIIPEHSISDENSIDLILPNVVEITEIGNFKLKSPLITFVEKDGNGIIASIPLMNLFGYGDNYNEAIDNLKYELESLFFDLNEDNKFSCEWLQIKDYLNKLI